MSALGKRLGWVALLLGLSASSTAHAEYVDGDVCLERTHDCTCADAPYMEISLRNQEVALETWNETTEEITLGAASTAEEARALFLKKFKPKADPRVVEGLSECTELDATKIAGPSILGGGAELDSCFCNVVCKDIVESTIAHERMHVAFNLVGIGYIIGAGSACAAGSLPEDFCAVHNAFLIAESEIYAHEAGNDLLRERLDNLRKMDPAAPEMECTWEPLPLPHSDPEPARRLQPPPNLPQSFFERLQLLASRFIKGAQR